MNENESHLFLNAGTDLWYLWIFNWEKLIRFLQNFSYIGFKSFVDANIAINYSHNYTATKYEHT